MKSAERIAQEEKLIGIIKTMNRTELENLNALLDKLTAEYQAKQAQEPAQAAE